MKKISVFLLLLALQGQVLAQEGAPKPTEAAPGQSASDLQKPPYPLDAAQLAWGKSQIQQMLKDRPAIAPYVKEGDELWNWTVRQFAGEYVRGGVQWDPGNPEGQFDSTACRPDPARGKKAYIQDTRDYALPSFHPGEAKTAPVLWWEMMLEFGNLMNAAMDEAIDGGAYSGKLGRADFAFELMAGEEIVNLNQCHDLFYGLWLPHCREMSLPFEDRRLSERFGKVAGRGWARDAFLKAFQTAIKKEDVSKLPERDRLAAQGTSQHFDFYTGIYDKNVAPFLKGKGLPLPDPQPHLDVETKFLDEIIAPIAAPTVSKLEPEGNHLLMDDFENGVSVNWFGAVWHSAQDSHNLGTVLKNHPFEPQEGGAPGSPKYAGRIWGHWGKHIAPWPWVTLRGGFDPEETPADLTAFSAVKFFAKGTSKAFLLSLVQPAVKDNAYYRGSFRPSSQWAPVTLSFSSFQQPPWGGRVPLAWDQVQCFQFTPDDAVFNDEDFDLWLDNIELLK